MHSTRGENKAVRSTQRGFTLILKCKRQCSLNKLKHCANYLTPCSPTYIIMHYLWFVDSPERAQLDIRTFSLGQSNEQLSEFHNQHNLVKERRLNTFLYQRVTVLSFMSFSVSLHCVYAKWCILYLFCFCVFV